MSVEPRTSIKAAEISLYTAVNGAQDLDSLQQTIMTLAAEKSENEKDIKRLEGLLIDMTAKYHAASREAKFIATKSKEYSTSHVASLDKLMQIVQDRTSGLKSQKEAWEKSEAEKDSVIKGLQAKIKSFSLHIGEDTSFAELEMLKAKVIELEGKLVEVYQRKSVSENEGAKVKNLLSESLSAIKDLKDEKRNLKVLLQSSQLTIEDLQKKLVNAEASAKNEENTTKLLQAKLSAFTKSQESLGSLQQTLQSAEKRAAQATLKMQESESQRKQLMILLKQNMELLEGNRNTSLKLLTGFQAKIDELTSANETLKLQQASYQSELKGYQSELQGVSTRFTELESRYTDLEREKTDLLHKLQILQSNFEESQEHLRKAGNVIEMVDEARITKINEMILNLKNENSLLIGERNQLTARLSEVLKEKEVLIKSKVELQSKMLEIEKFELAVIDKNLDLQEQVQSLEKNSKTTALKISSLEGMKSKLEGEVEKTKNNINVKDDMLVKIRKENAALEVKMRLLKQELLINTETRQNEALQIENIQKENNSLKNEITLLKSQIEDTAEIFERQKGVIEENAALKSQMKEQDQLEQQERAKLQKDLEFLKSKLKENFEAAKNEVANLYLERANLQASLEEKVQYAKEEKENLEGQMSILKAEIKQNMELGKKEKTALMLQITLLTSELKEMTDSHKLRLKETEKETAENTRLRSEIIHLVLESQKQSGENAALKSQLKEQAQLEQQERAKLQKDLEFLKSKLKENFEAAKNEVANLYLERANLQASLEEKVQYAKEEKDNSEQAKNEADKAKKENIILQERLSQFKSDFQDRINAVTNENTILHSQISSMESNLKEIRESNEKEKASLKNEIISMQAKLKEVTERRADAALQGKNALVVNPKSVQSHLISAVKLEIAETGISGGPLSSENLILSINLLKAQGLLILKSSKDIEGDRQNAISKITRLSSLRIQELKALEEFGMLKDFDEEEVHHFVYEYLFNDKNTALISKIAGISLNKAYRLFRARNLLIIESLQDLESERVNALSRLSNFKDLDTYELKVLTDLGLIERLEFSDEVGDFVYQFLFSSGI